MAMRRMVFHYNDGRQEVKVLGYDATVISAVRDHWEGDRPTNEIVMRLYLETNQERQERQAVMHIGGHSVEEYLNRRMRVFIENYGNLIAQNYCVQFV